MFVFSINAPRQDYNHVRKGGKFPTTIDFTGAFCPSVNHVYHQYGSFKFFHLSTLGGLFPQSSHVQIFLKNPKCPRHYSCILASRLSAPQTCWMCTGLLSWRHRVGLKHFVPDELCGDSALWS